MFSTKEILEKFELSKTRMDGIIRRKKKSWGLVKGADNVWQWPAAAVQKLEEHLTRLEAVTADIEKPSADTVAEKWILTLAKAVGEKLEKMQTEQKKELWEIRQIVQEIRTSNSVNQSHLEHKVLTLISSREQAIEEQKVAMDNLFERTDRRKSPSTWYGKLLQFMNRPFIERRKQFFS